MKKSLLLLAGLLIMALFVVACGSNDEPAPPPVEQPPAAEQPAATPEPAPEPEPEPDPTQEDVDMVLAWWGNPVRNEMTEQAVDLFTAANPHISVELQTVGWGDYWTMLATRAAGNALPDVIQMDWAFLEQYVNNGLLVDLRPFIDSGALDLSNVPDAIVETGRIGEGIYAVSIGMNAASMVYNATLMEELGITIEHNMTLERFAEIGRQVYAETGIRTSFAYPDPVNIMQVFMRARGIIAFEPDGMGGTVEDYEDFFNFMHEGFSEGWLIHPEALVGRLNAMDMDPLFFGDTPDHRAWNAIVYSNMLIGLQNAAPDDMELRMTTWPSENPRVGNYMRASMYFAVTAHSGNVDAAVELINFWTNSMEVNEIIAAERGIPISTVVFDAIAHTLPVPQQLAAEFVDFVADGNSTRVNPPRPDGSQEIVSELHRLTDMVAYGQMTPAQAAADLFEFGNRLLGN